MGVMLGIYITVIGFMFIYLRDGFTQAATQLKKVDDSSRNQRDKVKDELKGDIKSVEAKLTDKIDTVEAKLSDKIDTVEAKLTDKIDTLGANMATQFTRVDIQIVDLKISSARMSALLELKIGRAHV